MKPPVTSGLLPLTIFAAAPGVAAADHGLSALTFDWCYSNVGPFWDRPFDRGFLQTANNARLKFAFMWAGHDWLDMIYF